MTAARTIPLLTALALSACALPGCAGRPQDYLAPPGDRVRMPAAPALESSATQLGASREARPIFVRTHGTGPARVLIIGLIHGDEPEVFERFDDLWLRLTTAGYGDRVTLDAIATMNPDGYEQRRRGNARGVDLNRNWPAASFRPSRAHGPAPLSEPEAAAVHRHIERTNPDVIIAFHATDGGPFVDPDGPASDGALADALAEAFVRAAQPNDASWRVHADFTNPAGSLGTWYGQDLGRAVLTVELAPGTDPAAALAAATAGTLGVVRALARQAR
ncbi:MAG: M14 family zinc carboxypeptidase [Phycisphaerales bacterium JB060]